MPSSPSDAGTRFSCRVTWLVSDIASLLSARYISVESNFHYPTITTLLLGRSTILPIDEDLCRSMPGIENTDENDVFTLLFLRGSIECFLIIPRRRSYSSWIQYCCFALAMLCASCKLFTSTGKKWTLWRDDISSYKLLAGLAEAPTDTEEVVHPLDLRSFYMKERSYRISRFRILSTKPESQR
jgi:hypothetical protein